MKKDKCAGEEVPAALSVLTSLVKLKDNSNP